MDGLFPAKYKVAEDESYGSCKRQKGNLETEIKLSKKEALAFSLCS